MSKQVFLKSEITNFFFKINSKILNIFGIKLKRKFRNNKETISYKSNAWISKKSAAVYKKEVEKIFFEKVTWPLISENLDENVNKIVEVGAGTGRVTTKLVKKFADLGNKTSIKAIDISKNMLDYIEPSPNLEKIVSDAYTLPIQDKFSDTTIAIDFLMHFPNWEMLLIEMLRITTLKGKIIFSYVPEEHIKLTENLKLLNPNTVAFTEFTAKISELKLLKFCKENNCTLKKIIPYSFFSKNELFRPLLNKSSYENFIENYYKIYHQTDKNDLMDVYIQIEKLIAHHGDSRMGSLALAILEID